MIAVCATPVTVAAEPVTLPAIGAVTVNAVKVPTEVIAVCAAPVTVAAEPSILIPVNVCVADARLSVIAVVPT